MNTVRYVNDPFVDAGVAVLERRIEKPHVDFTLSDLLKQADELEAIYKKRVWSGYLTVHFPNSGWCNATMSEANKLEFRNTVLRGFDLPPLADRSCVYCSRPAQDLADRSKIPLLTGAANMSAGPGGAPGLPVCAYCLFSIQFYPLATLKVEGRPLFWWTHDSKWLYHLTADFVTRVARILAGSTDSFPNLSWPSTRLIDSAGRALEAQRATGGSLRLADLIGCHVTNYGSGPDYRELRIPEGLLSFLEQAQNYPIYREIVNRQWQSSPKKTRSKERPLNSESDLDYKCNLFYEDLGTALRSPDDRQQLMRVASRHFVRPRDVRNAAALYQLSRIFLEKVINMTKERLDAIERLATSMATSKRVDDILNHLFRTRNVIDALVRIQSRVVAGGEAAMSCSDVYAAFDIVSSDDIRQPDWWLVRDLLLLRILELQPVKAGEVINTLPDPVEAEISV